MPDAEKLKIALEALKELRDHPYGHENDAVQMHDIARDALREIQREHYLGTPSPVVAEVLAGVCA